MELLSRWTGRSDKKNRSNDYDNRDRGAGQDPFQNTALLDGESHAMPR
jgi:hypothetical protein